jgi:hypothetical protein
MMAYETAGGLILLAGAGAGTVGYVLGLENGYRQAVAELRDAITSLVGDRAAR